MIIDHGFIGYQEFGDYVLDPNSAEWRTITTSVTQGGAVVLMGCYVAIDDNSEWKWMGLSEYDSGRDYVYDLYAAANPQKRPTIYAYTDEVWHSSNKTYFSTTAGNEISFP
jgi:hypothetical protein